MLQVYAIDGIVPVVDPPCTASRARTPWRAPGARLGMGRSCTAASSGAARSSAFLAALNGFYAKVISAREL
jgi:hypothetical protein